jgi:hypothetical protein
LHEFENSLYRIECDKICDESGDLKIIDLAVLGHFFIVTVEGSDYLYECQEKHDASVCVSFLSYFNWFYFNFALLQVVEKAWM